MSRLYTLFVWYEKSPQFCGNKAKNRGVEQTVAREVHSLEVAGSSPAAATNTRQKIMAKEMIISTSRLNSYGSRVITAGIDTAQFSKNPVLLWMHLRSFRSENPLPIGRVENLRFEGDALKGTPVFDMNDPFAKQVADKWENGFLKMCSAGLDIIETSVAPVHLLPGQTRATVVRSKLTEVSIVDIGSNDDALQLSNSGQLLTLAAGEACEALPLLELAKDTTEKTENAKGNEPAENSNQNNNNKRMKKETLQLLGLAETATEEQVHEAVQLLKNNADKAQSMELAAITTAVDQAVKEKRITAAKRDHFIRLGKNVGVQQLTETLECMAPASKPTDVLNQTEGSKGAPAGEHKTFAKLSEVPTDQVETIKKEQPQEYARLYKAEYGVELPR